MSWALRCGLAYLIWRVWWGGFPGRSLEVLFLIGVGASLVVAASRLPSSVEPWLVWAALGPAVINAGLGLWNLTAVLTPQWRSLLERDIFGQPIPWGPLWIRHPAYPGQAILESHFGLPHGLLVHPNYWGLYLALCLPLVWWVVSERRRSICWSVVGGWVLLVATSRSVAAMGAAVVMALLLTGPRGLRLRLVLWSSLGLGAGWLALQGLSTPFPLGGRWPVWRIGIEWGWARHPWIGEGLGIWRLWAVWEQGPIWQGSPAHGFPGQARMAGWWAEAQGEPVQLFFELGLVGVGLMLWWAGSLGAPALRVWRRGDPLGRVWVAMLVGAGLTALATVPFRLPATVGLILVAAGRVRGRDGRERPG